MEFEMENEDNLVIITEIEAKWLLLDSNMTNINWAIIYWNDFHEWANASYTDDDYDDHRRMILENRGGVKIRKIKNVCT